jgi:hypothetical protein
MLCALVFTVVESLDTMRERFFQYHQQNLIESTEVGRCTIFTNKENGDRLYEICK